MMKKLILILLVLILISGCISEERINCIKSGGTWKGFSNSGADKCGQQGMGADIIVQNCDCGLDRCWNGNACISDSQYCEKDSDCVPSQCCHPTNVINKKYAPDCTGTVCSLSCETILDCGCGIPVCINNKCDIKKISFESWCP